ncbi:MAG: hypothetical protein M1837_003425 [Sclerophora amabilis]|nr:MAG: hypothetical protein M1837_003425 [Sclerophora amabilis]
MTFKEATAASDSFRWLLDVRSKWREDFSSQASPYLALLPPSTHPHILAYHFTKDRAMSLGSALVKYHAVHLTTSLPYTSIVISRDPTTQKPVYHSPLPSSPSLTFNVSHQAGLVALIGSAGPPCRNVGIDIVCVNERNDLERLASSESGKVGGIDDWVDMHAEVFAPAEMQDMKTWTPPPPSPPRSSGDTRLLLEQRLRRFYAFWALKEAYIKLKGEALLAPWLKEVEFRNVRVPSPVDGGEGSAASNRGTDVLLHTSRDVEVWFRGKLVTDVKMELKAFESNYMIATAVQAFERVLEKDGKDHDGSRDTAFEKGDVFPDFQVLDLEEFQRSSRGQ